MRPLTAAGRCVGPEPTQRRWLRALAESVTASPTPALVQFLADSAASEPWIVVRPASVLRVVAATPGLGGCWTPAAPPLAADGAPDGPDPRYGTALTVDRTVPPSPELLGDPPTASALVGDRGSFATQTFWQGDGRTGVFAARRWWYSAPDGPDLDDRHAAVATASAAAWAAAIGRPTVAGRLGRGAARDWRRLGTASFPRSAWVRLSPERLADTSTPRWAPAGPPDPIPLTHAAVVGASGAGKSWYLADRAARAIASGASAVVLDLHGDLAPAVLARLGPRARARVVAIDVTAPRVPGVSALAGQVPAERAVAHLVAAVKRLAPDGQELYWGFRLERTLEAFTRLAVETGGTLEDLYALLTEPDRRDVARLTTDDPTLVRFLDELGPIVRRTPDFLWSAAARLAKVVQVPAVRTLLAPADGGIPAEALLDAGRSIVVRLPFAEIGPEAASFAGSLLLARLYLGLAARRTGAVDPRTTLVVLDEVHAFSPRLVAEILGEGRKFGVRLLLATQFPERLAPELESAVRGTVREFVAFRVPPPGAPSAGRWLGVDDPRARRALVDLAVGQAVRRDADDLTPRPIAPAPTPPTDGHDAWRAAVEASAEEFGAADARSPRPRLAEAALERLLLAILGGEELGHPLAWASVAASAARLPGPAVDEAVIVDRLGVAVRQRLVIVGDDGVRLTAAGERRIGLRSTTGAAREGTEHRALLLATFRIFARHGQALEIVPQGRFDTRLPDGLFRQLPAAARAGPPGALAEAIDAVRRGWAWRAFGGRDVHVEAEVSGADRPARIRRGVAKARARGAYALFVVSDAARAARIRRVLRAIAAGRGDASVWTLRLPGADPPTEADPRT